MRAYTVKVENSGATPDGRLSAAEDSVRFYELEKAVTTAGITPDPYGGPDTDKEQLAQAMARYASGGVIGTCTGAANTYVVAAALSYVVPKALTHGMIIVTTPSATNTGATTANVFGLGSKKVLDHLGAELTAGSLVINRPTTWQYSTAANGGVGAWLILPWALPLAVQYRSYTPPLITGVFNMTLASGASLVNISGASTLVNALTDSSFTSGGLFTCGTLDAGVWQFALRANTDTAGDEIQADITSSVQSSFASSNVLTTNGAAIANAFGMLRLAATNTVQFRVRQINGGASSRTTTGTLSAVRIGA